MKAYVDVEEDSGEVSVDLPWVKEMYIPLASLTSEMRNFEPHFSRKATTFGGYCCRGGEYDSF